MSTLHQPQGGFPLDAQSEVNELRDIGAADCTPSLGSNTSWDDIDRMWAAEMERRDRAAACPDGYRNACCEACGATTSCLNVTAGGRLGNLAFSRSYASFTSTSLTATRTIFPSD